jgi:hypothetical protein
MISNEQVLTSGMAKVRDIANDAIIESLSELAEKSIEHVLMNTRLWHHRTFNLSDSYGYAIYRNGSIKKKWMNQPKASQPDTKGGSGAQMGSDFLNSFSSTQPWELVVVAGEFYAEWLDRVKSLDVLTGALQYTQENFLADFKRMN